LQCNNYHFPLERSTIACLYVRSRGRERQEFCKHRTVKAALWSGIIYRTFSVWNTSLAKRKTITTILWPWKYVKWIDSLGWTSFVVNVICYPIRDSRDKELLRKLQEKLISAELSLDKFLPYSKRRKSHDIIKSGRSSQFPLSLVLIRPQLRGLKKFL
jgi:hypothetical protein